MKKIKGLIKKISGQNGSTFIETLIAMTILAYVISGVLTMTTIQMKTNFNQINHTKAVKLAEEALERKMRQNFDALSDETHDFETIADFSQYSRTIRITTIDPDNKEINVSVTWRERDRSGLQPITLKYRRTR